MRFLTLFFLTIVPVLARIGESEIECDQRYGKPTLGKQPNTRIYQKSGLFLSVTFKDSKASVLFVRHLEQDAIGKYAALSETEIETLLNANSGGSNWKEVKSGGFAKKAWSTEDGKIMAGYHTIERVLIIVTKEQVDADAAEKKDEEKKKLDGF